MYTNSTDAVWSSTDYEFMLAKYRSHFQLTDCLIIITLFIVHHLFDMFSVFHRTQIFGLKEDLLSLVIIYFLDNR